MVAVALPRHPGREPRPAWFATGKRPESAKVSFPSSRRILLTLGQREMREAKQAGGTTQFVVTSNTSATHFEHCRDCTLVHTVAILTRRWQSHKAEPILENDGGLSIDNLTLHRHKPPETTIENMIINHESRGMIIGCLACTQKRIFTVSTFISYSSTFKYTQYIPEISQKKLYISIIFLYINIINIFLSVRTPILSQSPCWGTSQYRLEMP